MRHRKSGRKLGMDSSQRKAMFRNMVTSLMLHGQIKTTEARAKDLRRFADKVITLGKNAPSASDIEALEGADLATAKAARVHAIRQVKLYLNNDDAMGKVFGEYAERFQARPGGYTRVVKAGRRDGDNAAMAVIQLVESYDPTAAPVVVEEPPPVEEAPVEAAAEAEAESAGDDTEA